MTKEWVEQKNKAYNKRRDEIAKEIITILGRLNFTGSDMYKYYMNLSSEIVNYLVIDDSDSFYLATFRLSSLCRFMRGDIENRVSKNSSKDVERISELSKELENFIYKNRYSGLLDSEPRQFNGSIVITDPCYIIKNSEDYDNMALFDEEKNKFYMERSTIYGDWSCQTIDSNSGELLGEFCADSASVCVTLLDDVLEYNPDFSKDVEKGWAVTTIKNFKGNVQFVINEEPYEYEGETHYDYSVSVVGHGVNSITGEPINFHTIQTGF